MTIDEVKRALKRSAVIFERIEDGKDEADAYLGKVVLGLSGEVLPTDKEGNTMCPIMQFNLKGLSYIPKALEGVEVVTVFISPTFYTHMSNLEGYFEVRTYNNLSELVSMDYKMQLGDIKSCSLKARVVDNDYPKWNSYDIPIKVVNAIEVLEDEEYIDYFGDIAETLYDQHKIGGYAAYIQSGCDFGEGYEFVMQIVSDIKADFNIIQRGRIYFAKHKETGEWKAYGDFY